MKTLRLLVQALERNMTGAIFTQQLVELSEEAEKVIMVFLSKMKK